jgi:magnesium chelatase family protein
MRCSVKAVSKKGGINIFCSADMRVREIQRFCQLQDTSQSLMRAVIAQFNLSARAYHRILKLARTIADLTGSEEIQFVHLAERWSTGRSQ